MYERRYPVQHGFRDGASRALDILTQAALDHYTPHMVCVPADKWSEAMALLGSKPVEQNAVPVPDGVVVAFGLLWHVRMGCDFPVPPGFSKNISPEEAAAKARRFLSDLLTQEQKGDGINRASELLAASQREGGAT